MLPLINSSMGQSQYGVLTHFPHTLQFCH